MRYIGIDPSTKTGLVILNDGRVETEIEITTKTAVDPERFMIDLVFGKVGVFDLFPSESEHFT